MAAGDLDLWVTLPTGIPTSIPTSTRQRPRLVPSLNCRLPDGSNCTDQGLSVDLSYI